MTIKIKVLKEFDSHKKGEIINVTDKAAKEIIKRGYAEYFNKKLEIYSVKETSMIPDETGQKIDKTETIKEPVIYEGAPRWLIIKQVLQFNNDGRTIKEMVKNPKEPKIINEITIQEENIWECRKCGGKVYGNPSEPFSCTQCNRETKFTKYTGPIKKGVWRLPYWVDLPKEKIDMKKTFDNTVSLFKKCSVLEEEIQYEILTLWSMSTYKIESWDTVGWPLFLGLPNSGKSWMLDLLAALGHRMIPAYSATFPGVVRQGHTHMAGFCMDEIHTKFDPFTEEGKKWLTFIKPSYRRGNTYMVADPNDPFESVIYMNFGFKAFGGEYCKDFALETRCFKFDMQEEEPEIGEMKYITDEIDKIKIILLNYRYKTAAPPDLGLDFCIKPGRIKEIFSSIISTAMHIGIDEKPYIEYAKKLKEERRDELRNTLENEILSAVYELSCQSTLSDAPETLPYEDIRRFMDWEPSEKQSKAQINKTIGFSLRKILGLKVRREKHGWVLVINDTKTMRRLSTHYKKYGIW